MSPDLNSIENLWGILKRKMEKHKVSNIHQLHDVVMKERKRIPVATCKALILKMNNCEIGTVTEFYVTPFSTSRINAIFLFNGFLFMYFLAVMGNLIIIALVCIAPQLHTPMYFFLCNLSSIDVIYVSAIIPKMLAIIFTEDKRISFCGCMTQLYFFIFCAYTEHNILISMAYDRYVAICSPLHYSLIMTRKVCFILVTSYMSFSAANSLMFTLMISALSFCFSQTINHFFCELLPLIVLSSSDTKSVKMIISIEDKFGSLLFIFILISYVRIISTILKIRSSKGQLKAFSSCTSHLITVMLFYVPSIFLYLKNESVDSKEQDKILSMLYVAVVPMLNPFVYSLRNKEVIGAARKTAKITLKAALLTLRSLLELELKLYLTNYRKQSLSLTLTLPTMG
ncbi:olfactory receptor 1G1-like [Phyllobates terribilis]|uniref:olfactory receptor 1G1-like n=1 Tax=Phyllobates terribilis TaxID=111132 RepID=UPI003CCB46A5